MGIFINGKSYQSLSRIVHSLWRAFLNRVRGDGGAIVSPDSTNRGFLLKEYEWVKEAHWAFVAGGRKDNHVYAFTPDDGSGDIVTLRGSNAREWSYNRMLVDVDEYLPRIHFGEKGDFRGALFEPEKENLLTTVFEDTPPQPIPFAPSEPARLTTTSGTDFGVENTLDPTKTYTVSCWVYIPEAYTYLGISLRGHIDGYTSSVVAPISGYSLANMEIRDEWQYMEATFTGVRSIRLIRIGSTTTPASPNRWSALARIEEGGVTTTTATTQPIRLADTAVAPTGSPMDGVVVFVDFTVMNQMTTGYDDSVLALSATAEPNEGVINIKVKPDGGVSATIYSASSPFSVAVVAIDLPDLPDLKFRNGDRVKAAFRIQHGQYALAVNGMVYTSFTVGNQSTANPHTVAQSVHLRTGSACAAIMSAGIVPYRTDSELQALTTIPLNEPIDPETFYVTYSGNLSNSADIMYIRDIGDGAASEVYFRPEGGQWVLANGSSEAYPFTGSGYVRRLRLIHRVKLSALTPGTVYEFRFTRAGRIYRFHTPSTNPESVRAVFFGDTLRGTEFINMCRAIRDESPDFAVIGGDWAEDNGVEDSIERWDIWWSRWMANTVADNGRVIPMVPVIGNHEVDGYYHGTIPDSAPFFYAFFPAMREAGGYRTFDIGADFLSIVVTDTEHTNPEITGSDNQTVWLQNTLPALINRPHLIPVQHVPGYTSRRNWNDAQFQRIRDHWYPIYESSGVRLSFDHHEHNYKRTVPILDGSEDANGIVFLGGGCFGVEVRDVLNPNTTWYLEAAHGDLYLEGLDGPDAMDGTDADPEGKGRHFYLVEFRQDKRIIHSVNKDGVRFHTFEQTI